MTTIEQLQARIAELEVENARLVSAIDEHMVVSHIGVFNRGDDPKAALNKIACYEQGLGEYFGKELRKQLAASQAREQQLREALEAAVNGLTWWMDNLPNDVTEADHEEMEKLQEALSIPTDTSALESIVKKAGEAMRERAAKEADPFDNLKNAIATDIARAIRALPGVTLDDIT